jgi:hypothetical protein
MKDMLVVLSKFGDWYGGDYTGDESGVDQWNKYMENDRIEQTLFILLNTSFLI